MKKIQKFLMPVIAITVNLLLVQCDKMDVGYLKAENAVYEPNIVTVSRNLNPEDQHIVDGVPWTSGRIQGVSGTNPINYEIYDVKVSQGGDGEKFKEIIQNGDVRVQGSIIQLFQTGVDKIPDGIYTLTIKVYNEDHFYILDEIFSFDVQGK